MKFEPTFNTSSERFILAFNYATHLHKSQVRKGSSTPYLSHLMSTCSIAMAHGANEDEAIAALLHDAAEDCGGQIILDRIEKQFGSNVARIVGNCSDTLEDKTKITLEDKKAGWRKRKENYIAHLMTCDKSTQLVSGADKIHNAYSILTDYLYHNEEVWDRFIGGKDGTLWYYHSLLEAFRNSSVLSIYVELNNILATLDNYLAIDLDKNSTCEIQ